MSKTKKIVILGAGLSGLATAYFLKKKGVDAYVFEKEDTPGGLCRSYKKNGFTFDFSGHLLHFKHRRIFNIVKGLLGDNLIQHRRNSWVYSFKRLIPYPFQVYFTELPEDISKACLKDFTEAQNNGKSKNFKNFLEWSHCIFGSSITRYFMVPYNEKFWKISLEDLSHSWTERFIFIPALKHIAQRYSGSNSQDVGYNVYFWYPKKGGIFSLVKAFHSYLPNVYTDCAVESISLNKNIINFKDGRSVRFDRAISTIPLPELGNIVIDLPNNIKKYFRKLKWVSIYNLNLGLDGLVESRRHWIYFPDKEVIFFRVGFYHNFSFYNTPEKKSSLYVEISYRNEKSVNRENIASLAKHDLEKVGVLSGNTKLCVGDLNEIKYAYPIYDMEYCNVRKKIISFLYSKGIVCCGRVGGWQYLSMEDVIEEAQSLADVFA